MSERTEFEKRILDLAARCERTCSITHTAFLSPAERYLIENTIRPTGDFRVVFTGGRDYCERTVAFFIPEYYEPEAFDASEYISAVEITSYFGEPGHRDYLGALLALGIERNRLGDIVIHDSTAWVFCMDTVASAVGGIDKVGHCGVKVRAVQADEIPEPEIKTKSVSFSVMSLRLDAAVAGMFNLSRTEAAEKISHGLVSLNYSITDRADAHIKEGDIISLRGSGKGRITGTGGTSRKGRLFVYGEIYL